MIFVQVTIADRGHAPIGELVADLDAKLGRHREHAAGVGPNVARQCQQAARLRDLLCDTGQGYHFGRPSDPAEITGRLRDGNGVLPSLRTGTIINEVPPTDLRR